MIKTLHQYVFYINFLYFQCKKILIHKLYIMCLNFYKIFCLFILKYFNFHRFILQLKFYILLVCHNFYLNFLIPPSIINIYHHYKFIIKDHHNYNFKINNSFNQYRI